MKTILRTPDFLHEYTRTLFSFFFFNEFVTALSQSLRLYSIVWPSYEKNHTTSYAKMNTQSRTW